MTTKEWIAARTIAWWLRKRSGLSRAEWRHGMIKPLGKKWAWLGNLGAVGSVIASVGGFLPPQYAVIAAALAALLNSISHSLPGTGGK